MQLKCNNVFNNKLFILMIAQKIRQLAEEKKVTLKQIADYTNITQHGFNKMLNNDDFKTSILMKIATFLKVPVSVFFEERVIKTAPEKSKSKVIFQIELDEHTEENTLKLVLGNDFVKYLKR
jgi:transcriptional regulator with XRE-family HTH domain